MTSKLDGGMIVLVLGLLLVLASFAVADEIVQVQAGPDGNGGVEARAGFNLLAFTRGARARRAERKAETQERRAGMTFTERAADHLDTNWRRYAVAGGAFAIDRWAYRNDTLHYEWLPFIQGRQKRTSIGGVGGDQNDNGFTIVTQIDGHFNTINYNFTQQ
jgi:hypothetical protein